jgi:hypothetical protein
MSHGLSFAEKRALEERGYSDPWPSAKRRGGKARPDPLTELYCDRFPGCVVLGVLESLGRREVERLMEGPGVSRALFRTLRRFWRRLPPEEKKAYGPCSPAYSPSSPVYRPSDAYGYSSDESLD